MKHGIVYAEQGIYAGWPANHGAWQWGNEFLVGFLRGKHARGAMHNIKEPFEKLQARSLDGGKTWRVEKPNVDFECVDPRTPSDTDDLLHPDTIFRVCGIYDHGGEACYRKGGFYTSQNKGYSWAGPWAFNGVEFGAHEINTSRTCIWKNLWFLSKGQEDVWGTDYTTCYELQDNARFIKRGVVCDDGARAVMPAVADVGGRLVAVLRRRVTGKREGWIESWLSTDRGLSWHPLSWVGSTGGSNGNPPALLFLPEEDALLCAFGNRDEGSLVFVLSRNQGQTWEDFGHRRNMFPSVDVGYPRLFLRSDGIAVCVYYWIDDDIKHQHIAFTEI